MELVAIGGDLRYAYLVRQACIEGMRAAAVGLEKSGLSIPHLSLDQLHRADRVVLPNPFVRGVQMPLGEAERTLAQLLEMVRPGTRLLVFGPGKVPAEMCDRWKVIDLNQDECLIQRNAVYTAEGAVFKAGERLNRAIEGCPVLVIGYGRIARALNRILQGMGARVTVAARSREAREAAELRGARAVDMKEMLGCLSAQRLIFSTPPERVLEGEALNRVRSDALLIDLSSPPYGVDVQSAQQQGIQAWREPGLPGRYCPESAGIALLEAVKEAIKREAD